MPRLNDAITTHTGREVQPLSPDPNTIDIYDIAHALSNQCRFTGHTKEFYSVAQHSVLVGRNLERKYGRDSGLPLWGLLHDASEAYLADIARPVKRNGEFGRIYRETEDTLMEAIAEAFNLPWPMPAEVHEEDGILLVTEMRDQMPQLTPDDFVPKVDADPYVIVGWSPKDAERHYLSYYAHLSGQVIQIPKKSDTVLWETKRTQRQKD